MGSNCCSPPAQNYQLKVQKQHKYETEQQLIRRGFPTDDIAISLNMINDKLKPISKISQVNSKHEKKFKNSLKMNKKPINQNKLPDTYYIPSLQMFYVGEWVFDPKFNNNVPGGIGRLYQDDSISEGVFKTFPLDQEQAQLIKKEEQTLQKQNLRQTKIIGSTKNLLLLDSYGNSVIKKSQQNIEQRAKPQNIRQSMNKIQRKIYDQTRNLSKDGKFVIKLHGTGRIKSIQQGTNQQIQIQGQFYYGILNGRGSLKILRQSQQFYSYIGLWRNGQKNGKGAQKVRCFNNSKQIGSKQYQRSRFKGQNKQSFYYEGNFFQNYKHGKGQLTFFGLKKDQNSVQKDIDRMQNKLLSDGQNMKKQAHIKTALAQQKQKQIQLKLNSQFPQLPASQIKINQQHCLIYDSNFVMQRSYRTIFNQKYSGEFRYGKMEGQGTYIWPNGKTYKGKWKDNMMNDQKGQFYWPDGSYYQGGYLNDQKHGKGIMIWNQFKRYRGDWAFGYRHGYGQSIQLIEQEIINQNNQRIKSILMIIKCSIWQKDKTIKKLRQLVTSIDDYYKQDQNIIQGVEEMFMTEQQKKRMKRDKKNSNSKQINQSTEDDIFNLQSFKDIAAQNLKNKFKSSFSKLQSTT